MRRIAFLPLLLIGATFLVFSGEESEQQLGTEGNPIIWALVPSGNTQDLLAGADRVIDLLEERTGYRIQAVIADDYAEVIAAIDSEPPAAHMAAMNPLGAIVAADRGAAEVALVSLRDGLPYYEGQIVAAAESGISELSAIEGTVFARVDPTSVSGWIIPQIVLLAAGIDPEQDIQLLDAGSHPAVVQAVAAGAATTGATYVDAREELTEDIPDIMDRVVVISTFGPIPNDGIQLSTAIPPEVGDTLIQAFLDILATPEGAAAIAEVYDWNDLVPQSDDFYDPLREIIEASGIDLGDLLN
jgi:phosphonate transport system substrate-binding protein